MVAFMHKCHSVTTQIMSCFALGLGLPEEFFQEVSLAVSYCRFVAPPTVFLLARLDLRV